LRLLSALFTLISIFGLKSTSTHCKKQIRQYDRSGRSIGTAIISFETAVEATRAKKQFDGYLAKGNELSSFLYPSPPLLPGWRTLIAHVAYVCLGQPMRIAFDTFQPPRAPRRAVSAPTTASLINRIEKPPLAERISHDDSGVKIPSAPYVHSSCFGFYLHSSLVSLPRRAFTGGPVRNRPSRGANGARPPRGPKKAKTAEELDNELDAFMGDAELAEPTAAGDVDMV
jgi:THO complex subunit 4